MKKNKQRQISHVFIVNTLIIFCILIIVFLLMFVLSILAFQSGFIFRGKLNPFGIYIFILCSFFALVIYIFYLHNAKITNTIKDLELATDQVSKGNFKIQIPLTTDENINSFILNFNKMVRELNSMETLKEDFISNVSHEFKTPLSVIQSYSKALRDPNLDDATRKQYEEVLDNNIKKLTNLTSNILSLSRLEHQEIVLDKKEYLLDEQIRQTILDLEPEWSKKNIDLKLNLHKTKYYGSENLINQVWQNIINNAIKFSNTDGKISISISKQESDIIVTISDNGIGMSEDTINKIFDKFYQGDKSHSMEGNGLGLALVKRILNICNGEISVSSKENEGSTFVVTLHTNDETK